MQRLIKVLLGVFLVIGCKGNIITTAQGRLEGVESDGYVSYIGIPYAEVHEQSGRFKMAGLAPTWNSLRPRQTIRLSCPSWGTDDCLVLDIHEPNDSDRYTEWPVFVWVKTGNAEYNPELLVKQGFIVVNVIYRSGPLGFLCLDHERIPGNAGVKDLVVALRWVRDNIAAFRGSPSNVVLAGQGFGAGMVEALTLSPMAEGLFHGAILQSGTILSPSSFNYDAKYRAESLTKLLTDSKDFDTIVTAFINADIDKLAEESQNNEVPYYPFGICLEKPFKSTERLLTDYPIDMLASKQLANKVPIIIGYNSEEAYIFAESWRSTNPLVKLAKDISSLLPKELVFYNEIETQQLSKKMKSIYFSSNMSIAALLGYSRDAFFLNHIYRSAVLHSQAQNTPVYLYQFQHVGEYGVLEEDVTKTGAAHSDELAYLFPDKGRIYDGDDGVVQGNLIKLWSNFIINLNPNSQGQVLWEPFDPARPRVLNIGTGLEMVDFPHFQEMKFWEDVYDKHYYKRQNDDL